MVYAKSIVAAAACPDCHSHSHRVHSYYQRKPDDLPFSAESVQLRMRVRRFRCLNSACPRVTFAEALPAVRPYARRTSRLAAAQGAVAIALGGEAGARLLPKLKMSTSPDTLLRGIRRDPLPPPESPRVLGVDDWAVCKGRSYGTILVDLERHCVLDVLPDRTSSTLASWLRKHPGIEVITRDRSSEYAKGAVEGAPHAIQVADRWHLLQNARQMLERYLPGVHARLRRLPEVPSYREARPEQRMHSRRSQAELVISREHKEQRLGVYRAVKVLREQGWGIATIARELGIDRKTARKYADAEAFPERVRSSPGESILDPFLPYLHLRWQAGCENASELWRELKAQGYLGSKRLVLRWMSTRRRTPSKHHPVGSQNQLEPAAMAAVSPLPGAKRLAWLLCRYLSELDAKEQAVVTRVRQDPEVAQVHDAVAAFVSLVRRRTSVGFDVWLAECRRSSLKALRTFAKGIESDYQAVKAALEMPWSNAQCEGQVTRLKFVKRQMYGRAKFDLLRRRVLLAA